MIDAFETVLKSLDKRGREQFGNKWMKEVQGRSKILEESYKILNQIGRDPINYSELATQAAYVFAYGMPRAYFTDEFLRRHRVRHPKGELGGISRVRNLLLLHHPCLAWRTEEHGAAQVR